MSRDVETITPDVLAEEALGRMTRARIHHLVVVDREEIVGVLSARDLTLALADSAGTPRVGDLMTRGVLTASPRTSLREAANILRGRAIGCLPIVEYTRLVGIVTISDMLRIAGEGGVGGRPPSPRRGRAAITRRRPGAVPTRSRARGEASGARRKARRRRFMPRWLCLPLLLGACTGLDWGPDKLGQGHTSQPLRQVQLGRDVYALYCAGCHGERGDGNGQAARFLDPKPRDFRVGRIKFGSVPSGEAARDEDYLRIVRHGLSGTAMPGFALLSDQELDAVVAYVRTFYPDRSKDSPGGSVSLGRDPWVGSAAAGVEEGKRVYHGLAKCWSCHPAYETHAGIAKLNQEAKLPVPELRPNLYESETKESEWGAPIRAPDFLSDRVKNGIDVENLALIITAGVGGTAMPIWAGALEPKQLWGLAYYVRSLSLQRGTPEGRALRDRLASQPAATGVPR